MTNNFGFIKEKFLLEKCIPLKKLEIKSLSDLEIPVNLQISTLKRKLQSLGVPQSTFKIEFTLEEIEEILAYPYSTFFDFKTKSKNKVKSITNIIKKILQANINESIDEKSTILSSI